jgi:EAL domain-containing protein (putative c-di-GMP-specific phosphodiesterase class I)
VKTILMLGENLDIEVVAEGIETESQLATLNSLGCRLGQGFLFSEPVSADEVHSLLTKRFTPARTPILDLDLPVDIVQLQEIQ